MSWGERGTGPGQFNLPHAIAVDRNNQVYVGDRSNRRIQVFDTNGKFLRMFTIDVPPAPGTRPVNGNTPTGARARRLHRRAQLDLHHARAQPGDVRGREHVSGAALQGLARRQGAGRHRPIRQTAQAVLRRSPARVPIGVRSVRGRDVELAGAEAPVPAEVAAVKRRSSFRCCLLLLCWPRRAPCRQPTTGPRSADRPARATRPSAACRSSGANRRTSSGRRRCRAAGGRRPWSPAVACGSPPPRANAARRCAFWHSTSRPARRRSTSRCSASGARTCSTSRTATPRPRRSSTAIASTCTSAPRARPRSRPPARSSGRPGSATSRSTASADRRRSSAIC